MAEGKIGYKVSLVIPVFNEEECLKDTFDLLDALVRENGDTEAVMVDDGSDDGTLEALRVFARSRTWVKVLSQTNSGISVSRNAGIEAASGRYIFFLDVADVITPGTLAGVTNFFDQHYDEVDLVTYPMVEFKGDKERPPHYRYGVMNHSGIYDLRDEKAALICQTSMNICVKKSSLPSDMSFSSAGEGVNLHEDTKFIFDVLSAKGKIGFCEKGLYRWNRDKRSAAPNKNKPYFTFEDTIGFFEAVIAEQCGKQSPYVQGLILDSFGRQMFGHVLLPIHLKGQDYIEAMSRLSGVLGYVDDELIASFPGIADDHRLFFLRLKHRGSFIPAVENGKLFLKRGDEIVFEEASIPLVVLRVRIASGQALIVGMLKSPFFWEYDGPVSLSVEFTAKGSAVPSWAKQVTLVESARGYEQERSPINRYWSFRYEHDANQSGTIRFRLNVGDVPIPIELESFGPAEEVEELGNTFVGSDLSLAYKDGSDEMQVERTGRAKRVLRALGPDPLFPKLGVVASRKMAQLYGVFAKKSEIWLYSDSVGKKDNAWLQFQHDSQIDDGIKRYYVANHVSVDEYGPYGEVVRFRSRRHKILFCNADKLLCSDSGFDSYSPMLRAGFKSFKDMFHAELIYLQHGVLWAHLPWLYSYDYMLFDKVVVSSRFELENFVNNYGFKSSDLIPSGMARFDHVDLDKAPQRKILLCPSWRSYLIGSATKEGRKPCEREFLASAFYSELKSFLKNPKLQALLEEYDYAVDFKLHPIFEPYRHLFSLSGERVKIAPPAIDEADYSLVVTDYSSYSFDFVYLKRGVIYFIPDADLFFGGVNHYGELDIPFEEAFGPLALTSDDLLEQSQKADQVYRSRTESFFLHYDHQNRQRLYDCLKGERL